MRRIYNRLFHPVRRERKQAILQDFERDLIDTNPRMLQKQYRMRLFWKSAGIFTSFLFIGSIAPNYFGLASNALEVNYVNADFESEYADSVLLTLDEGFLAKTYIPTENSKNIKGVFTHEVRQGDTISTIAQLYGVSSTDLILNNELSQWDLTRLKVGEKLLIAKGVIHTVKKDESLAKIAKKYEVGEDVILASNDITETDVETGKLLVVPGGKRAIPSYVPKQYVNQPTGLAYKSLEAIDSGANLLFPTRGQYTNGFKKGHYAVDIANNQSPPIYAAAAGIITKSQCGWNGGYGCHIIIDHDNGMKTLYAHMRKLDVTVGEVVSRGQILGQMGNSGKVYGVTGIHLHFEVIIEGIKRNPVAYF